MKRLILIICLCVFTQTSFARTLNVCVSKAIHLQDEFLHLKVYETLLKPFGKKQTIVPLLIKEYKISKDEKTYHFILRKKIPFQPHKYFNPTRDLNAEDVKFSLEKSPLYTKVIQKIEIKNPYEFDIKLVKKDDHFLKKLASRSAIIKSAELQKAINQTQSIKLKRILQNIHTGTGPFIITDLNDHSAEFETFNKYFLGQVQFEKLIIKHILSDSERTDMLKNGLCDIAYHADLKIANKLPEDQFLIQKMDKDRFIYFAINAHKPILKDNELRYNLIQKFPLENWGQRYFFNQAELKDFNKKTTPIDKILKFLKVKKVPPFKMASYKFSSTWCPFCKKILIDIQDSISNSLNTSITIDRSTIPAKVDPRKLLSFDFILTPNEKTPGFETFQLFQLKNIVVINKVVNNFFYFRNQDVDYSLIDFKLGPMVINKPKGPLQ